MVVTVMFDREKFKSDHPFVTDSVRYLKRRKNELSALKRHLSRRLFQKNNSSINEGRIKVVFICQYIPAWSKNKQLYETLKRDDRFEVILLCIPNRISANKLIDPENMSNDVYDYFSNHGYGEAVNALIGKDEWYDLKEYHPDYVIYNRYDRPMPVVYTSSTVAFYSKICLIIYGPALLRIEEYMPDRIFTSNTYCFFAESKSIKRVFEERNSILGKLKLSKAFLCGLAGVENAYKAVNDSYPAWNFSKNGFRIIYTPRWTTETIWGGTTFLKYKDTFISMADNNTDMDILIRPHPLMFNNFISKGIMSESDVNDYITCCDSRDNLRIDKEKEYLASFWNSDVLISDFSSIIIEYFVTGKPIVYLTYDEDIDYTDQMRKVLSGCYMANDEEELYRVIVDLKNGVDPLYERRKAVIDQEFASSINTSENMKRVLLDNYNN